MRRMKQHWRWGAGATTTLALGLAACGPTLKPGELPVYRGSECGLVRDSDVEADKPGNTPPRAVTFDRRMHALTAVCDMTDAVISRGKWESHVQRRARITPFDVFSLVSEYDGRPIDPVQSALVAMMPIAPLGKGAEAKVVFAPRSPDEPAAVVGMRMAFARSTDRAALDKALTEAKLTPEAKETFLARYDLEMKRMEEVVRGMSPAAQKVYVVVPKRLFDQRRVDYALYSSFYDRLTQYAVQMEGGPTPELAEPLLALRTDYMAQCAAESCTYEAFYFDVSLARLRVCIQADDALCAYAEHFVLTRKGADDGFFGNAVNREREKEAAPHREAFRIDQGAEHQGLDSATRTAMLKGVEPLNFPSFPHVNKRVPSLQGWFRGQTLPGSETGVLASVLKRGDRATLIFRPESKVDNVSVPAGEGISLKVGETITLLARPGPAPRTGLVLQANRGDKVLQIRGDRLRAAP